MVRVVKGRAGSGKDRKIEGGKVSCHDEISIMQMINHVEESLKQRNTVLYSNHTQCRIPEDD